MKKIFLRFGLLLILTNCSTYVEEAINKDFKPLTPTIAEMKATETTSQARNHGFPLQVKIEEEWVNSKN